MLRRLLACTVILGLIVLSVPLQATTTVKRVSLISLTGPIPYPGKLLFTTGKTSALYRVTIYAQMTNPNDQVTVGWYCPTAFGTGGSAWPAYNDAFNEGYVVPTASSPCYYWIDTVGTPQPFNVYFTVEKI